MRKADLESWAYRSIEAHKRGSKEDSFVEFKRELPDPKTCARQLAGHANASSGHPVLWLVGIDDKQASIPGDGGCDLANWTDQLAPCFDDRVAPALLADVRIPVDDVTVLALLFETDRAPYVVKHPGKSPDREIPWRTGTATGSAHRHQVLSLGRSSPVHVQVLDMALNLVVSSASLTMTLRLFSDDLREFAIARERSWLTINGSVLPNRWSPVSLISLYGADAAALDGVISGTTLMSFSCDLYSALVDTAAVLREPDPKLEVDLQFGLVASNQVLSEKVCLRQVTGSTLNKIWRLER